MDAHRGFTVHRGRGKATVGGTKKKHFSCPSGRPPCGWSLGPRGWPRAAFMRSPARWGLHAASACTLQISGMSLCWRVNAHLLPFSCPVCMCTAFQRAAAQKRDYRFLTHFPYATNWPLRWVSAVSCLRLFAFSALPCCLPLRLSFCFFCLSSPFCFVLPPLPPSLLLCLASLASFSCLVGRHIGCTFSALPHMAFCTLS